jgi:SAM-dependent methyltransferase
VISFSNTQPKKQYVLTLTGKTMAGGTTMAMQRRVKDSNFANRYFVGNGLDIGGGPDPLAMYVEMFPHIKKMDIWDMLQGDAQFLHGIPNNTYDFVHSSHCLEHLLDCREGLRNWFRVLKPQGHLVIIIPDEDLYEQRMFPSTFNKDHKWTFTLSKVMSWSPVSVNVLEMLSGLGAAAEIKKIELLDAGFRYTLQRFDQCLTGVSESAIEIIIRKRTEAEVADGGRSPPAGTLHPEAFAILTGRLAIT